MSIRTFKTFIGAMSDCIFCKIIKGDLPGEILYENDELSIFKDIKPAAKHHYLAVPKEHIVNVNRLTEDHNELLKNLVEHGTNILQRNGGDVNDIRMGFHNPPFNSISHLHLHIISPASSLSMIGRVIFRPNTWWFTSVIINIQNIKALCDLNSENY